jgi:hypothetical protein
VLTTMIRSFKKVCLPFFPVLTTKAVILVSSTKRGHSQLVLSDDNDIPSLQKHM